MCENVTHDISITGPFTVMSWETYHVLFFFFYQAVDGARNLLPDDYEFKELTPLFL